MTDKQQQPVRLFPMPSRFAHEYRGGSGGHVCVHALGELEAGGNLRREPSGYFSWSTPDIDGKLSILCPACGLLAIKGAVVMRCPGTPFTDLPIPYDEADLNNAIELNLLEKKKMLIGSVTGSSGWEWYVVREKATKRVRARRVSPQR